jgi:hypothetical protein
MTRFNGRGLIQLTGRENMSLLNKSTVGIAMGQVSMPLAKVEAESAYGRKTVKKISFEVHQANGGYVVEVGNGYGTDGELYIIGEEQDLGCELGKIITFNKMST